MEFIQDNDLESTDRIQISSASDLFQLKKEKDHSDPFMIEEDDLRKISGLSSTFRRKMGREFSKAFAGREGTEHSKTYYSRRLLAMQCSTLWSHHITKNTCLLYTSPSPRD